MVDPFVFDKKNVKEWFFSDKNKTIAWNTFEDLLGLTGILYRMSCDGFVSFYDFLSSNYKYDF